MPASQVFISYRRDDSAGYARAIHDELARQFGADRVFIDVDDIAGGQPFGQVIGHHLDASSVVLVLIGKRWAGDPSPQAASRLHQPQDLVAHEVASALASGALVLPLLLDGAAMPSAAQLPARLQALAGRNALALDHSRYATDMARLVATVQDALGLAAGQPPPPSGQPHQLPTDPTLPARQWLLGAAVLGGALLLGLAARWWWPNPSADGAAPATAQPPATAQRPAINGRWAAVLRYGWSNTDVEETFDFSGSGTQLQGSASFLRVPRTLEDGRLDGDQLQFITRSTSVAGASETTLTHRYQGRLQGDELRLQMHTTGGASHNAPLELVARRLPGLAASRP